MKKTTVTLSLKERYTVGILAKQLHTTRSCVMHKALHVYAKALRYQKRRDKKSHLRSTDKPFTNTIKIRTKIKALNEGVFSEKKPFTNVWFLQKTVKEWRKIAKSKRYMFKNTHKKCLNMGEKSHLRTCIVLSEKPFTKCQKAIYELEYVKKRTKKRIIYR